MTSLKKTYTGVVEVSNAEQLKAVIANYTGNTTILLKGGDYGMISIKNKDAGSLTIASASAESPATMTLSIANSSNITVRGLDLETNGGKWANALSVSKSNNITIENNTLTGVDPSFSDQARGLYVDRSSNVTVKGNEFSDLVRGAVVTNSTGIDVLNNSVEHVRSEGFNFSAVTNVEIAGNKGTNFVPKPGDHPDFIQFWTRGAKSASEDIHIHDNVFTQGSGGGAQGIFMDNDDKIPYKNVVIENNQITTSYPNGIVIGIAENVVIKNNVAIASPTSDYKVQIRVTKSDDVDVSNNVSNALSVLESTQIVESGNTVTTGNVSVGKPSPGNPGGVKVDPVTIQGTSGNDTLQAKKDASMLYGGAGNDVLKGGGGDDYLSGGTGHNMMNGGGGADTFVFSLAEGKAGSKHSNKLFDLDFTEGDKLAFSDLSFKPGTHVIGNYDQLVDFVQSSGGKVTATQKGTTDVLVVTVFDKQHGINEVHVSDGWKAYQQADLIN